MKVKDCCKKVIDALNSIQTEKDALRESLIKISADDTRSDAWKLSEREKATEQAKEKIMQIYESCEESIRTLEMAANSLYTTFDYSNPKMLGAISFITNCGENIPDAAVEQIIRDFSGKAAELSFLSDLFAKHGALNASIIAKEKVKDATMNASLPQRLSDSVFYAVNNDAEKEVDFSNLISEISAFADGISTAEQE